jgi:mono/diheme cytochrome c family protein
MLIDQSKIPNHKTKITMSRYADERPPFPTPSRLKRELNLPRPPQWMLAIVLVSVVLSWVPLVLIARARTSLSTQPRIHPIQDMDNQVVLNPQAASPVFADGRAMRPPVPGTVSRQAHLSGTETGAGGDDHFANGFRYIKGKDTQITVEYFRGMPDSITVDMAFLQRGQRMFNIYCAPCHGIDGYGTGPVTVRAELLQTPMLTKNLHTLQGDAPKLQLTYGEELYPDGQLYNVIRNGVNTMPGYGAMIAPRDRWAVVAYVRALQQSQRAGLDDVPPEQRDRLR